MTQSTPQNLDIELGLHDVQDISSADAVAAFFVRLGYSTGTRTPQTPANLGITAEGTARPIKKVELIADQEGLLQVVTTQPLQVGFLNLPNTMACSLGGETIANFSQF